MRTQNMIKGIAAGLALVTVAGLAQAGAVRGDAGFTASSLAANDDGSTAFVDFGLGSLDFYGTSVSGGYLNNNGNVTFSGPLSTFTPFPILTTGVAMLAPFFADVDTRGAGSGLLTYGSSTIDGHAAFGVNWIDVGYFAFGVDKLNSFQLVIIDRSDTGAGNFDFEFNYDKIEWETGSASGGSGGLGGSSARVGWSDGVDDAFELSGSAVNGAFLDSGPGSTALILNSLNSAVDGRYLFEVRGGVIGPIIPLPTGAGLGMAGLIGLAAFRRRHV